MCISFMFLVLRAHELLNLQVVMTQEFGVERNGRNKVIERRGFSAHKEG